MSVRHAPSTRAVLVATAALLAAPACASSSPPAAPPPAAAAATAPAASSARAPAVEPAALPGPGLAPIVARARPAIVTIVVRRPADPRELSQVSPLWGMIPRGRGGGDGGFAPEEMGEGSGVVVRADGIILTNRHVVEGATQVEVGLTDGRKLVGRVLGVDEPTDIAVVKVAARDLPVVRIGDSSALQIGDFTLAIGSPFGLGQSVTFGIVSAVGRSGMGLADYEDFIQTDAAINPGNSGGALLDTQGRLIGINTAILAHGAGGNQGVGFAVPVNLAVSVMRQLIAQGHVVRGYLGVGIQDLTPELAAGLGAPRPGGALVGDVEPGGPAGRAGLQRGDVVVSLDGQPVTDSHTLRVRIASMAPGTVARLGVQRDRRPLELSVSLGTLPGAQATAAASSGQGGGQGNGLRLADLTREIRGEIGADVGVSGAVVADVAASSPADDAGLRSGDIVQEIDGHAVAGASAAAEALRRASSAPHVLLVRREHQTFFVPLSRRAS
jgi:serine protease Do